MFLSDVFGKFEMLLHVVIVSISVIQNSKTPCDSEADRTARKVGYREISEDK